MLIKPLESIYMSVQAERSMTALIEKYSVEKIKCLITTRDVALLGYLNNNIRGGNVEEQDFEESFPACNIVKLNLFGGYKIWI